MTPGSTTCFDHLAAMCDPGGLFEHARGAVPRVEHGYCTDDNARMLVVTSREEDVGVPGRLSRIALSFTLDAQDTDGRCRNRRHANGIWTDTGGTDDCWGRALWGLGVAAAQHRDPSIRRVALTAFERGAQRRSRWPRAMAFASLGAREVLATLPGNDPARSLLEDTAEAIGRPTTGAWCWPEPRLTYANAALAEALLCAGDALRDDVVVDRGLVMLRWLLTTCTVPGHLSVPGTAGRGPADRGPQFDQQPIEVGALADACWRALVISGDPSWASGIDAAAQWFAGRNDSGLAMCDPTVGASFDGLQPGAVNRNQGAESTLAYLSTMQRAAAIATRP